MRINYMLNNHLLKACLATVFAIGLAACSSSSDNGMDPDPTAMPDPDPEMTCTDAGGRWNADMTCTSAGELTQEQLAALQQEIADLREQLGITDADDIGDSIDALMEARDRLQQQIDDAAEEEQRNAAEAAAAAMAATAAKLYTGISASTDASDDAARRHAAYNADDSAIVVSIGDSTDGSTATLSADEDAMVAANRGWAGMKYADPAGG